MDAQCKICGDVFTYSPNQVSLLAEHFCYDHEDLNVGYYTIGDNSPTEYNENSENHGRKRSKQSLIEKTSTSKERGVKSKLSRNSLTIKFFEHPHEIDHTS